MLDVLCLCLSHNLVPMAALAKEQPSPNNVDTTFKQSEHSKVWKNGHHAKQQPQLPPSLSNHRKTENKENKKHFKNERRKCFNNKERLNEDAEQKNKETPPPLMKYDKKM